MGLPFWIAAEDNVPVGVIAMAKEPIALLAPAGTAFAIIDVAKAEHSTASLKGLASEALRLAAERHADFAIVTLNAKRTNALHCFFDAGFRMLSDSYGMVLPLNRDVDHPDGLTFTKAERKNLVKWTELASRFLAGSPDEVLARMVDNMATLPSSFLDMIYGTCEFFFVNRGRTAVGILQVNVGDGKVVNVGIDPSFRGNGYGRQAMVFGLQRLKEAGCQQAMLRVHVENKTAVDLYRSLGFTVQEREKTLMWER